MVNAARLGFNPVRGTGRIKAVQGGLVTTKKAGSNLGAKMKARLTSGTINKVGSGAKGNFVLANKFGTQGKVLIRKKIPGQVKGKPKANAANNQNQVLQGRVTQRNSVQTKGNAQFVQKPRVKPQQGNVIKQNQRQNTLTQKKPRQFQQKGEEENIPQRKSTTQQSNETKLALDIINILLEDKKKIQAMQQPTRNQRRRAAVNWDQQYQAPPQTVYVQQQPPPQQQPIYVQQAPKTVYVDDMYEPAPRRVLQKRPVIRQQPVVVQRRVMRTAPTRMVQRRLY